MKVQSSKSTEFFLKKIKTPKGKSTIFIQICTKNFPPTSTVLRAGAVGVYFLEIQLSVLPVRKAIPSGRVLSLLGQLGLNQGTEAAVGRCWGVGGGE